MGFRSGLDVGDSYSHLYTFLRSRWSFSDLTQSFVDETAKKKFPRRYDERERPEL